MSDSSQASRCPECGAPLDAGQTRCWLCWRNASESDENPYASPHAIAGEYVSAQFSLAFVFLAMTLVAVEMGVIMIAPGLGVLMLIVATPALFRTMIAASYRRQAGAPLTPWEKLGTFLVSWFIMGAIGIASFVAFAVVCFTVPLVTPTAGRYWGRNDEGSELMMLGLGAIAGLIAAVLVMVWMMWLTRPAKIGSQNTNR